MANSKKATGDFGESAAADYLTSKGYALVARNFRTRMGEIDLIMRDARYLLFVEVKARKFGSLVSAEEAIDIHKQRRLRLAAEHYLATHATPLQPRFDVICIDLAYNGTITDFRHIENAF